MKLTKQNIAEIATLLYDGATSAQIAEKFGISVPTVQYHRAKLKKNGLFSKKVAKSKENTSVQSNVSAVDLKENKTFSKAKQQAPKDIHLKVNGVLFTIAPSATHVKIWPDHIEIQF
jgi:transposase